MVFTELDIYQSALQLHVLLQRLIVGMRKDYRSLVGASLYEDTRKIVRRIQRANAAMGAERIRHIEKLRERLELINLSLRGCVEPIEDGKKPLISRGQYADAIKITESIGKQATGWKKKSESRL